jgi:chondroitin AC lyase
LEKWGKVALLPDMRAQLLLLAAAALTARAARAAPLAGAPDANLTVLSANVLRILILNASDPFALSAQRSVDAEVPALVVLLNASGLFPDVDYDDSNDMSEWKAATHLQRCLMMATSAQPSPLNPSRHRSNATVGAAADACLAGWLRVSPSNSNWWWMQIGTLSIIARLLILRPNATLLALANAVAFPRLSFPEDVVGFTGANRVWTSSIHVLVGLLNGNATHVDLAFALLHEALLPASGDVGSPHVDGIQADGAFHQHGPLMQASYAYGAHFAANALAMETAAAGTRWAMDAAHWTGLSTYLLGCVRFLTRGSEFHLGAMGRHNTYYSSVDPYNVTNGHYHVYAAYIHSALSFLVWDGPFASPLAVHYARLLPPFFDGASSGSSGPARYPRADELAAWYAQILAAPSTPGLPTSSAAAGHVRFWRSDYSAHVRPSFSLSLHTSSNRTLNTECVNGEGVQNRGMADGLLTVHVTGREYAGDTVPVWRWSLLPGTTQLQSPTPYTCPNAQITDPQERLSFVGGVTDGWMGSACQDLARGTPGSLAHMLRARKSWFFLEAGAVALGSGIASNDGQFNAVTTLDQRALAGDVLVGNRSDPAVPIAVVNGTLLEDVDIAWVLHDSTVFGLLAPPTGAGPGVATVGVSTRTQAGSWAAVTQGPATNITAPVFLAYLHHGPATAADAGTYEYAVLPAAVWGASDPGAAAAAAWAAFEASTAVTSNTATLQSVCQGAPNATLAWTVQAVAWPPPAAAAAGGNAVLWTVPAAPAPLPCPSVNISGPALVLVALDAAGTTLTVTASSPEIESGVASVQVEVGGVTGTGGGACVAGPAGGLVVTVTLPAGNTTGSSAIVSCAVQAAAV